MIDINHSTAIITFEFQIFNEPVDFKWVEKGRVESLEYADHVPSGGNVKVYYIIIGKYL